VQDWLLRTQILLHRVGFIALVGAVASYYFAPSAHSWFSMALTATFIGVVVVWVTLNAHRLRPPGGWHNI
jgi:hypothetical protein